MYQIYLLFIGSELISETLLWGATCSSDGAYLPLSTSNYAVSSSNSVCDTGLSTCIPAKYSLSTVVGVFVGKINVRYSIIRGFKED